MITVKKDAEFMTNYVLGQDIHRAQKFCLAKDDEHDPIYFIHTAESELHVLGSPDGEPKMVDFAAVSGIGREGLQFQQFEVHQAPDNTLDISAAVASPTGSTVYTAYNVTPTELLTGIPAGKLTEGLSFPKVASIFLGTRAKSTPDATPNMMVAFERPDRSAHDEDMCIVDIKGRQATRRDFSFRANRKKILSVHLGTMPSDAGQCIFIHYEGFDGKNHIDWKYLEPGEDLMTSTVLCTDEPKAIATCWDPTTKSTILLVAGRKLTLFKSSQYYSNRRPGTVVGSLDSIGSIKGMTVAQSDRTIRLWFSATDNAVHYNEWELTRASPFLTNHDRSPICLRPKSSNTVLFSSMMSLKGAGTRQKTEVSSFLSHDNQGNLLLLQQDSVSGVWRDIPVWRPAVDETVKEINGHTLRFQVIDDQKQDGKSKDLANCWLLVSCDGLVRCMANDKHVTITRIGQWLRTDVSGSLRIAFMSDDFVCHTFTVDRFKPANGSIRDEVKLGDAVYHPTRKIADKIREIRTADHFLNLRKPDGSKLFSGELSEEEGHLAAESMQAFAQSLDDMHKGGTGSLAGDFNAENIFGDIAKWAEGAWNSIMDAAQDAVKWVVEKVESAGREVWKFVVHMAGEVYHFVLDTLSNILNAIKWVFKKLGALWKEFVKWVKFLFNWGDIKNTSASIVSCFNTALDYADYRLQNLHTDVHSFLDNCGSTIKGNLGIINSHLGGSHLQGLTDSDNLSASSSSSSNDEEKFGVAYSWASDQCIYSGALAQARFGDMANFAAASSASNINAEIMKQLWDEVASGVGDLGNGIKAIFKDIFRFFLSGSLDFSGLIRLIAEHTIDTSISLMKTNANIIFKCLGIGLDIIRRGANREFHIPLISTLWRMVSGGRPLTLINVCALLVAVPTTLLFKAKKKCAPYKLEHKLNLSTYRAYLDGYCDFGYELEVFSDAALTVTEPVYNKFKTFSVTLGMFGAIIPLPSNDTTLGVLDNIVLSYGTLVSFFAHPTPSDLRGPSERVFIRQAFWTLKLCDMGATAAVDTMKRFSTADKEITKRWNASVSGIAAIPTFYLEQASNVLDMIDGDKNGVLISNNIAKSYLDLGKALGDAVGAWDGPEDAEAAGITGVTVSSVCSNAKIGLRVADFVIKHV